METNVYFLIDNKVQVAITDDAGEPALFMRGVKEEVEGRLRGLLEGPLYLVGYKRAKAIKAALAKLLFTPISWD